MILVTLVAAATPTSDVSVRGMIREAREIILQSGGQLWAGYPKIPLPVLLIDEKQERLFCGQPAAGFRPAGIDRVTGCPVQRRPRQLPVDLAAATDLDQQSVIEIGLPSAVGLSRPEWIVTLVHETFPSISGEYPEL